MAKMPTKRVFSRAPGPSEKIIREVSVSMELRGFDGSTLLLLFNFLLLAELKEDRERPSHWSWGRMTPWSWRCPRGKDAVLMLLIGVFATEFFAKHLCCDAYSGTAAVCEVMLCLRQEVREVSDNRVLVAPEGLFCPWGREFVVLAQPPPSSSRLRIQVIPSLVWLTGTPQVSF